MKKIVKHPLFDNLDSYFKQMSELKLNNAVAKELGGTKRLSAINDIVELEDALWAGKSKSLECMLMVVEGLSAKAMGMSGIAVLGRERLGVLPLQGKGLNVAKSGKPMAEIIKKHEICCRNY